MAGNPYDRQIINPLERPLSFDIDQLQSQIDRAVRDSLRRLFQFNGTPQTGFLDNGLQAVQNSPVGMSVLLKAGIGFLDAPSDVPTSVGGIVGADDLSPYKPLPLNADMAIAIDAAPSAGNERIDIIEVKQDRRVENPLSRDVLNTGTGLFVPTLVNKTLAFSLDGRNGRVVSPANSTTGVGYKVGVVAAVGTAVAPATTSGYVKIAQIYVGPSVTTIVAANITDFRSLLVKPPGTWLGRTVITTVGSGTFTTSARTSTIQVTVIGGGGGGGGTAQVSYTAGGGGGGGGAPVKRFVVTPSTGYSYTLGAGGAGGTSSPAVIGSTGGASSFGPVSGVTITGNGGLGGSPSSTAGVNVGGGVGGSATNGDINIPGQQGSTAISTSANDGQSGTGGSTPLGTGGANVRSSSNAPGFVGTNGGGGGGGGGSSTGAGAGGAGGAGLIVIDEYA